MQSVSVTMPVQNQSWRQAAQRNGLAAAAGIPDYEYYCTLLASQLRTSSGEAAVSWSRCWVAFDLSFMPRFINQS
jgi:hypothetical protein